MDDVTDPVDESPDPALPADEFDPAETPPSVPSAEELRRCAEQADARRATFRRDTQEAAELLMGAQVAAVQQLKARGRSHADAEDAVAEAMMTILRQQTLDPGRSEKEIVAYLFRTANWRAGEADRRTRDRPVGSADAVRIMVPGPDPFLDLRDGTDEPGAQLRTMLTMLLGWGISRAKAECLVLQMWGYSARETAALTGGTDGSVRQRWGRGRHELLAVMAVTEVQAQAYALRGKGLSVSEAADRMDMTKDQYRQLLAEVYDAAASRELAGPNLESRHSDDA